MHLLHYGLMTVLLLGCMSLKWLKSFLVTLATTPVAIDVANLLRPRICAIQCVLRLQLPGRQSSTLISQPHTHFSHIAVETLGPINESAVDFLCELGRRSSSNFQE